MPVNGCREVGDVNWVLNRVCFPNICKYFHFRNIPDSKIKYVSSKVPWATKTYLTVKLSMFSHKTYSVLTVGYVFILNLSQKSQPLPRVKQKHEVARLYYHIKQLCSTKLVQVGHIG